jgi:hypothetical protein
MFTGRDEQRPSAVSFIMDVDAMQPLFQATRIDFDANQATSFLGKGG